MSCSSAARYWLAIRHSVDSARLFAEATVLTSAPKRRDFMRIITLAMAGTLVFWAANSALAAKRNDHKSDTTVQKTEQESTTNPHAPGQQRFRRERHKKTSHQ
jgi:hypothetical protein